MARVKRTVQDGYNEPFASRLRALIDEKNISQSEFAAEIGVTRQAISSYTLGNTVPNADVLTRLSKKYDVSVDYLLGLANDPVTDKDKQYVSKYTGLSSESIDFLNKKKDDIHCSIIDVLNYALAKDNRQLELICDKFDMYSKMKLNTVIEKDNINSLSEEKKRDYLLFSEKEMDLVRSGCVVNLIELMNGYAENNTPMLYRVEAMDKEVRKLAAFLDLDEVKKNGNS